MQKALKLQKLTNESNLRASGASWEQKSVSSEIHSHNIWNFCFSGLISGGEDCAPGNKSIMFWDFPDIS